MLTMAIGAVFGVREFAGQNVFVWDGVDFILRMTSHAERINLFRQIHNLRRRTVSAPSPGFIINVGVALTVTIRTTNTIASVNDGNILINIVYMADMTAAVIGHRPTW